MGCQQRWKVAGASNVACDPIEHDAKPGQPHRPTGMVGGSPYNPSGINLPHPTPNLQASQPRHREAHPHCNALHPCSRTHAKHKSTCGSVRVVSPQLAYALLPCTLTHAWLQV